VQQHDAEGFGGCTNIRECEAACPKAISIDFIGMLNRDYYIGTLKGAGKRQESGGGG
jgi:succinate dehydrogenase / fumarate reductase, iron-sulfur subunit